MLHMLNKHCVLDAGSFKSLKVVSLGRSFQAGQPGTLHAIEIFVRALNLCSTAHTVHNRLLSFSRYPDNVFQRIESSDFLRVLDLGGTYLGADQIIQFLSRAKRLYEARLALLNHNFGGEYSSLSDDMIIEFREKHSKYQSNVQLIKFVNFSSDESIGAAASIVMIADTLPGIKKVIVAKRYNPKGQQILSNIGRIIAESIFKTNDNLQSVRFVC
ncbi:hypothetical protein H4R99_002742 [Coemansia sp. RSA 1722]|nr:hypothetical protein IWW45_005440 [Coemansia sp. RSA 485]KAJ2602259.1 hypothetical protein H4R99_002742 [Coemansia sp. RSA 1722]KAJ2636444.1 hypothetical protein GGF40_002997 [Coemansia sp. RSA 1286]